MGCALRISNRFSGAAAAAAGPRTTPGVARIQRVKHIQAVSWHDCAWHAGESRRIWNHDIALLSAVAIWPSSGHCASHPFSETPQTSAVPACSLFLVFFSQDSLSPLLLMKAKRAGRGHNQAILLCSSCPRRQLLPEKEKRRMPTQEKKKI